MAGESLISNGTAIAEAILSNMTSIIMTSSSDQPIKVLPAPPLLKQLHDYLIVVLLVTVMFAMGCSITWMQVWSHVKRPVGVVTGMISQFMLLPFAAFTLITMFEIQPLHAAGLLILASSPGGVTSNVFTFFCDGDLSLSVTMTGFSTVVALVMMPFNVWLYGRSLETEAVVIPYSKMTFSLFFLTAPVVFGTMVHWKLPKLAKALTKIGSFAGFGIIVVCQTMEVFIFPDIFTDVPLKMYVAVTLLPILGICLGYVAALIFQLRPMIRRTIAIECGIQNVGTALAIVSLSYPYHQLKQVWLFPFLYAFSMLGVCVVMSFMYQIYKRVFNIEEDGEKSVKIANSFTPGREYPFPFSSLFLKKCSIYFHSMQSLRNSIASLECLEPAFVCLFIPKDFSVRLEDKNRIQE